jgi:hypothetical protein
VDQKSRLVWAKLSPWCINQNIFFKIKSASPKITNLFFHGFSFKCNFQCAFDDNLSFLCKSSGLQRKQPLPLPRPCCKGGGIVEALCIQGCEFGYGFEVVRIRVLISHQSRQLFRHFFISCLQYSTVYVFTFTYHTEGSTVKCNQWWTRMLLIITSLPLPFHH